ncbi:hypothetical protein F4780DRAFT_466554 [Xylariomycetidae sp. FL0641]|nr:hypothetical protein F4780DRAFT_466554 [Xylariomycetidae sp. FL0641]
MGKDKSGNKKASTKKQQASLGSTAAVTTAKPPNWPPFRPALPVTPPVFDAPVPGLEDQILVLHNFFPRSLCRDYVAFLKELPLSTTPGRPKRGEAVRVNDRFQIHDPLFAQRLWLQTGLKEAVMDGSVQHLWGGSVVSLNPNIRVYRYGKNQFFDCHYDDANMASVPLDDDPSRFVEAKTTFTLLLYLTSAADGVMGGETVFYPHDRKSAKEEIAIPPETGMLLLHKHGDNCLLHEGREVLAGEKWILRTDLCVRK